MTKEELQDELGQGRTDYEFFYAGKHGSICPFNKEDGRFFASVTYGDFSVEYFSLEELMNSPVLNGQSLADVAEDIELYG